MIDPLEPDANGNDELHQLFQLYAAACPPVEPSPNFMPQLWERIEQRGSVSFFFTRLSRPLAAGMAVLCLLLVLLNMRPATSSTKPLSYPDALVAAQSAEKTYFAEGIRPVAPENPGR